MIEFAGSLGSTHVTVRLCGGFELRGKDSVVVAFRSNRVIALLAYLALNRQGKASRDEIADCLWPNLDTPTGRNNLRLTLQYLKRALEEAGLPQSSLEVSREWIALDSEWMTSDVQRFRALWQEDSRDIGGRIALLASAADSIEGPLLPELRDDWVASARQEISEERFACFCELTEFLLPSDPAKAASYARQACDEDPFSERGPELLALSLIALGKRAEALQELRRYERRRLAELGTPLPARLEKLRVRAEGADGRRPLQPVTGPPTSFHGRERDMARLGAWLSNPGSRLIALYGPGGIGKTRLATEFAAASQALPTLWVELAHVTSGQGVLETVAHVAGDAVPSSKPPLEHLSASLGTDPILLVLDNVEQICDADLPVISKLLQALPGAKILVTSRKTLGLPGETLLRLDPLELPEAGRPEESPAFQLFLERARACLPDLALDEAAGKRVAEIARRLEGIPLAIELAAARLTAMGLEDLLRASEDPLNFLVAPRKSGSRHGAMRSILEWSFARLDPQTARAVRRLGVLRGSWDSAAARAITEGINDAGPIDQVLQTACENSLITLEPGPSARFRMLECTRQYAWESLQADERDLASDLHARHFLELAQERFGDFTLLEDWPNLEAALTHLARSDERAARLEEFVRALMWVLLDTSLGRLVLNVLMPAVHTELPSATRAALLLHMCSLQLSLALFSDAVESASAGSQAAAEADDPRLRSELLALLARGLYITGHTDEGEASARQAIDLAGEDRRLRAKGLQALARVLNVSSEPTVLSLITEAVEHAKASADALLLLDILDTAGVAQMGRNRLSEAEETYREMQQLQERLLPSGRRRCLVALRLATVAYVRGSQELARDRYETALDLARGCHDEWVVTQSLTRLGDIAYTVGDYDRSLCYHLDALEQRRQSSDTRGTVTSLLGVGTALLALGREEEAYQTMRPAVETMLEVGPEFCLCRCILPCAETALRYENGTGARQIASAALALFSELQNRGFTLEELEVTPSDVERLQEIATP